MIGEPLTSNNVKLISVLVLVALVLVDLIQPFELVINLTYVIMAPIAVWLLLRYFGPRFRISAKANDQIHRMISATLAGMLMVLTYQLLNASFHWNCTESATVPQGGQVCVANLEPKKGPDENVILLFILVGGSLSWFAVKRNRQ